MDAADVEVVAEDLDYLRTAFGPDISDPDIRRGSACWTPGKCDGSYPACPSQKARGAHSPSRRPRKPLTIPSRLTMPLGLQHIRVLRVAARIVCVAAALAGVALTEAHAQDKRATLPGIAFSMGSGRKSPPPPEFDSAAPIDRFGNVNGLRLHFLEWTSAADKPVLVLIPGIGGGGGSAWQWAPFARSVRARYRVLAMEPRGFGESQRARSYTWQSVVDDIDAFVNEIARPPVILIAHSFGVRIAALYSARRPENVSRLVLIEGEAVAPMDSLPATVTTRRFSSVDEALEIGRVRWGTSAAVDEDVRTWIAHGMQRATDGAWIWRFDPAMRAGVFRSLPGETELRRQYARIAAPVLIVRGATSTFTRERATAEATAFPHALTAEVPNAGHVVHLANPDAFRTLVTQFIESQPADSVATIISAVLTADSVFQQALLTSDTIVLKRLLAPGWTMFHSNGHLQTRESFLNEFREADGRSRSSGVTVWPCTSSGRRRFSPPSQRGPIR